MSGEKTESNMKISDEVESIDVKVPASDRLASVNC
jgi:hypothetical protein